MKKLNCDLSIFEVVILYETKNSKGIMYVDRNFYIKNIKLFHRRMKDCKKIVLTEQLKNTMKYSF